MSGSIVAQTSPTKPKKRWMPFLQLAVFLGIIAAIYLSFAENVLSTTPGLPTLIGGATLSHTESGSTALAEIRQMFAADAPFAKGFIAHYKGNGAVLTIRAGELRDTDEARNAMNSMISSVEKGQKKGYADLKKTEVQGRQVYSVKIDEMSYFIRQYGNGIMWIDIMEGDPNQILSDVLRAFK